VVGKFPKYHVQILLGDFNINVGREDILKSNTGIEVLQENDNDNGIRAGNFATSRNLIVKVQRSHIVTYINLLGHLTERRITSNRVGLM
jgi:hypothetical protein